MWGEQTDSVNLDTMLWPRLSAAGEVLWKGQPEGQGAAANLSQTEASPRLADMRERLLGLGIRAEPVHMPYCTMYQGDCVL
jgi:hexosaminidase